jgi:hypothetical protein
MQAKDQVEKAFRSELQALLDKYGAELEARDHWIGYAECGEDVRITADIPAIYRDGETLREWTEIDLGAKVFPSIGTTFSAQPGSVSVPTYTLAQIDAAFEREIVRVSELQYNSNAICRKFYGELRALLAEGGE